MSGSYDFLQVGQSVWFAIAASYAALDLAGRVTATQHGARLLWLSGGAISMESASGRYTSSDARPPPDNFREVLLAD
jgi:NO-binding membrane sensor protein with MHYT domain